MTLIYLQGADVPLSVLVTDSAGDPVTGSETVSVTVSDPTGATTSPVVSEAGSGVYKAVVADVAAEGIWTVEWTAPGFAYADQFTVRAIGLEAIVDLASVKAHLNIPPNDGSADDELLGFIYAAGDIARDFCGPFLPELHTQWFDGGVPTIAPDWAPLTAVASVTEYYGLSAFPLTEQPLGGAMDAFAFTVDYTTGVLTRRTYGGDSALFATGCKNIKLVYTAGDRPIPYTVRLGALELIRHLYQLTQQGGRPSWGSSGYDGDGSPMPIGFAVPNRVIELWAPFRRPPGVA